MIGRENRLQEKRKISHERLFGRQFPVKFDLGEISLLTDSPYAPSIQIAGGPNCQTVGRSRFNGAGFPIERIGKQGFSVKSKSPSQAVLLPRLELLDLQIHRQPATTITGGFAYQIETLLGRGLDSPVW